ncbi:MAG: hypothetical protein ACRESG_06390 [Gammaproteobacteria bacterium]
MNTAPHALWKLRFYFLLVIPDARERDPESCSVLATPLNVAAPLKRDYANHPWFAPFGPAPKRRCSNPFHTDLSGFRLQRPRNDGKTEWTGVFL